MEPRQKHVEGCSRVVVSKDGLEGGDHSKKCAQRLAEIASASMDA